MSVIYVHVCMHVCMCGGICMCTRAFRGTLWFRNLLTLPSASKTEAEHSLNSDLDDPSQCHWDALPLPLGGWHYRRLVHLPSFHTGSRDPNSSPQACVTNALSTRPSPQPGIVCTCCTSVSCSVKWEE